MSKNYNDKIIGTHISVFVNHKMADQFVEKANGASCKILNVSEWISNELLEYIIECPETKTEYILELAFMTFISNPKFQKYYDK
jgi:hypothetical protein